MRKQFEFVRAAVVLGAVLVAAAGIAAVGSARSDTVDTTAKLGPKPARGGQEALYRTTLTNKQGTATKVLSTTTFPTGTTFVESSAGSAGCTPAGTVLSCDFGNVAAGVTVGVSIQVTLPNPAAPTEITVPTLWQFKDPGGGQPPSAESYDDEIVSDKTTVYPSGTTSVNGDCVAKTGGSLSASLGDAAISFTTPAFGSLLCVPLGLQVGPKPSVPVACFPGRKCTSETLTSFAGATFSAGSPAQGTLVWPGSSVVDKKAAVVFNDGTPISPLLVPLCANVTLSATVPACEVGRKFSGGLVSVTVRWLGNDPTWDM
jgi:hypothetical protein